MGKVSSVLRLTRIEHSIMLIVAVVAAELISGKIPALPVLVLSIITPVFVSMSAFAINDYFDVDVDRANRKRRPLVTGELSRMDALYISTASAVIGIAASVFINAYCLAIALVFAALSFLYSYRLKDLPLIGNSYIAFSMAIPFIFGSYVVSRAVPESILIIFAMVFLSGLAREIDATVRDYDGDRSRNARTLPAVIGKEGSVYLALLFYVMAIVLSVEMFVRVQPFMHNAVYAVLIGASDLMLLYSGIVYSMQDSGKYDIVRNVSLAGMGLALVCMLISALVNIQIPL